MGNVFADQNNNNKSNQRTTNSNEQLDSSQQYTNLNLVEKLANAKAAAAEEEMSNPAVATLTKSPQIKCNDIANELNRIQEEIHEFDGQKNDKDFLKLDEFLTRCLLKLDEIDRSDEFVNQQRKTLISFTHELADYLESKCQKPVVGEQSLVQANINSLDTNSLNEK